MPHAEEFGDAVGGHVGKKVSMDKVLAYESGNDRDGYHTGDVSERHSSL